MAVQDSEAEINLSEVLVPATGDASVEDDTTQETTNSGTKRRRSEPRDPNAPKRPCSAYIFFSTEMRPKLREENPEMSLSERSKYIGKAWATLEAEKKKRYQDMANEDKQRYIRDYLAYQETETYKQFMRKKHPGLKKSKAEADTASTSNETAKTTEKAASKMPVSCQQQYIPGSNIPIFSEKFLQHNRDLESQLRKLRQTSANLEEENALLSRHVENMKLAVEKVQNEVKNQEERNDLLQNHLTTLREVLAVTFKDISLPGTKETPTASSIDSYMTKLQSMIANEPEKHPALVEKVGVIAKHLEKVLKEKLSQDIVGSIFEGGTVEDGEGGSGNAEPSGGNET